MEHETNNLKLLITRTHFNLTAPDGEIRLTWPHDHSTNKKEHEEVVKKSRGYKIQLGFAARLVKCWNEHDKLEAKAKSQPDLLKAYHGNYNSLGDLRMTITNLFRYLIMSHPHQIPQELYDFQDKIHESIKIIQDANQQVIAKAEKP